MTPLRFIWCFSHDCPEVLGLVMGFGGSACSNVRSLFIFCLFPLPTLEGKHSVEPTLEWLVLLLSLIKEYPDKLFEILLHGRFISPPSFIYLCNLFIFVWTSECLFYALSCSPTQGRWYFQKNFQLYTVIFIYSKIMIFQRYFGGLKLRFLSQYVHISFVVFHIIRLLNDAKYCLYTFFISE